MSTRLTGYKNSITTNDDYILACCDSLGRPAKATIMLTKVSAYDGTVVVKQRPVGSAQAYQTANYSKPPGSAVASAAITPDAIIEVDIAGKETVLTTAARTTGSLQIDVAIADDV